MKSAKILGTILGIVLFIGIVAGFTYAFITWTSNKENYTGGSGCFDILYVKGADIGSDQSHATLMPSTSYSGGLSATVKMSIDSKCTTNGKGKIYLETLANTSSNLYRSGLLNYQVLKNGTVTDIKGSITSAGKIEIDVGNLTKASSSSSATSYQIYVWIDNNLVENSDAYSSYYGRISAEAMQVEQQGGFGVEKKKLIGIILGVILLIALVVGITYAVYTFAVNDDIISATSECFDVVYTKGADIGSNENKKTLMIGSDYSKGLSSTIKVKTSSSCTINTGTATLYLTTEDATSDILLTSNVLNYTVLEGSTVLKTGVLTSKGKIPIYENFTVNTTEKSITVYVWISGENITNDNISEILSSSYYGRISATVVGK